MYIGGLPSRQIWGIRLGRCYLSLAGPKWMPLFSERNRRGVSVLPLFGGWRVRFRLDQVRGK